MPRRVYGVNGHTGAPQVAHRRGDAFPREFPIVNRRQVKLNLSFIGLSASLPGIVYDGNIRK